MDKLMDYVCDQLEELERKADKEGKLSMPEIEYLDKLTHIKKNILKIEDMDGYSNDNYSYARGRKRDSRGRYSSRDGSYNRRGGVYMGSYDGYSREDAKADLMDGLRDLEQDARDEETKHMVKKWIKQVEQG